MLQTDRNNKLRQVEKIWLVYWLVFISLFISQGIQAQQFLWSPPVPLFLSNLSSFYRYNASSSPGFMTGWNTLGYQPLVPPPMIRRPPLANGWINTTAYSTIPQPSMPSPSPVIRQAAATISILITAGPTQALLVYNPTILFGASASAFVPTALTLPSLLSGKPLIFGTAPLTPTNLAIFNYVANSLILPSGISFFILP